MGEKTSEVSVMPSSKKPLLKYEFGEFVLDVHERQLLKKGVPVALEPRHFNVLVALVRRPNELAGKDELLDEVWEGVEVEPNNLTKAITALRKALGDDPVRAKFIATVTKSGYRFIAPVQIVSDWDLEPDDEIPPQPPDSDEPQVEAQAAAEAPIESATEVVPEGPLEVPPAATAASIPIGKHWPHLLVRCLLYASLYGIALAVEVAYDFDRLGPPAMALLPWLVVGMFGASLAALWIDWRVTTRGGTWGLSVSIGIFAATTAAAYIAATRVLPAEPVTQASFQTLPGYVAYLKTIAYFLALALVYVVLPFHLVAALHRAIAAGNIWLVERVLASRWISAIPGSAVYVRAWWLGLGLTAIAIVSFARSMVMYTELRHGAYYGLFVQLHLWRVLAFYALGFESLIWYSRALNELRLMALERPSPCSTAMSVSESRRAGL
jgi:DNA-binding winged helix-turn-helix (wHTH) protein